MVLKYGRAEYRPLAAQQGQSLMRAHDILCYHTMAGYLTSTDAMFKKNGYGGTESHLGVGGKWGGDVKAKLDGKTYQWVDMRYTADANLDGNPVVLSVETADNAFRPIQGWTNAQLETLIAIGAEVCSHKFHYNCPSSWTCRKGVVWNGIRVGIPPVMIPDTKRGRRGLGVHRQGCQHSLGVGRVPGYLVAGGVRWSKATGKDCPTDRRVAQFQQIVVPGIQALMKPKPAPPKPPAPKPPTPTPPPVPVPPVQEDDDDMTMYLVTIKSDTAQFVVGINGPGDVQHLETTDEVRRFKALGLKSIELEKTTFLRLYDVPLWEAELPVTTGA